MLIFIICLLITVFFHELAHLLVALFYNTKVKTFSVGFGKPYLSKKIKGIEYRLSFWLLGGYCDISGMNNKNSKRYFLSKPYYQKFQILVAGVVTNFVIACICYLINYKSITLGLQIDWAFIKAIFTNNYFAVFEIIPQNVNIFLLQLSLLNLFCAIGNILPIVPLDGGLIWMYLFYDKISKKVREFIYKAGWVFVMGSQIVLIGWIYREGINVTNTHLLWCILIAVIYYGQRILTELKGKK